MTVFGGKYVKAQSMATAKHKSQKLGFNPTIQKLIDYLEKLQKPAEDVFRAAARNIIEQDAPNLSKSMNQAN